MKKQMLIYLIEVMLITTAILRIFDISFQQLSMPFDLAYESPQMMVIQQIRGNHNPYDPNIYENPPFYFTMYSPLYLYLVSFLPIHPENPFYWGRIISALFMFLSILSIFFAGPNKNTCLTTCLTAAIIIMIGPVITNAMFLRFESAALFFSISAVLLMFRTDGRGWWKLIIVLLCALSILAKQNYIFALISCSIYLFLKNRKEFWQFIAISILTGSILYICLSYAWGSSIWFCLFKAAKNIFSIKIFIDNWAYMLQQPSMITLCIVTICLIIYMIIIKGWKTVSNNLFFIYLIVSGLWLLTVGRNGASYNYFFEFILAMGLWISFSFNIIQKSLNTTSVLHYINIIIMIGLAASLLLSKKEQYLFISDQNRLFHKEFQNIWNDKIKKNRQLKFLNLCFAGYGMDLPGIVHINDPFLYLCLWSQGVLNPSYLIKMIQKKEYDYILLHPYMTKDGAKKNSSYSTMIHAIYDNYVIINKSAYFINLKPQHD